MKLSKSEMIKLVIGLLIVDLIVVGAILLTRKKPAPLATPKTDTTLSASPIAEKPTGPVDGGDSETRAEARFPQTWDQAVDGLKLIKIYKDSVSGSWRFEDGLLTSERTDAGVFEIPYEPPEEYDFRTEFTVASAGGCVGQILSAKGSQFGWYAGAYTNTFAGFQMIDGKAMPENPTGVKAAAWLLPGHTYVCNIEVRRSGAKAFLDGKLISDWKTDYRNMSLFRDSKLRNRKVLGLFIGDVSATFKRIQIREVSGKGTLLHGEGVPVEF